MDALLESVLNAAALRPDSTAYEEGREAFLDGYSDDMNKYQRGTALHEAWQEGWDHEHEAHADEVASDAMDAVLDDPRRGQGTV